MPSKSIKHSNLPIIGGNPSLVEYDDFELYNLPGFEGSWFSFFVEGNSMEPVLLKGEMIFCQKLDSFSQITDYKIYVIVNIEGLGRVKFVKKIFDVNGDLDFLLLHSKNSVDYLNSEAIHINDVRSIFKVSKKLIDLDSIIE